jgi:hypothetical protein
MRHVTALALCGALASGSASAPVARLPAAPAAHDSPANGTWVGSIQCSAAMSSGLKVALDEFDIEDGRAQGTAMRYNFYGRFDANGSGHIVGRIRQRDGSDGLPFELVAELRDNRIVGTGRYEFVGPIPGAKDGPVNRQGTCSAEMQRVI